MKYNLRFDYLGNIHADSGVYVKYKLLYWPENVDIGNWSSLMCRLDILLSKQDCYKRGDGAIVPKRYVKRVWGQAVKSLYNMNIPLEAFIDTNPASISTATWVQEGINSITASQQWTFNEPPFSPATSTGQT